MDNLTSEQWAGNGAPRSRQAPWPRRGTLVSCIAAGVRGTNLRSSFGTAAPSGWDPEARGLPPLLVQLPDPL